MNIVSMKKASLGRFAAVGLALVALAGCGGSDGGVLEAKGTVTAASGKMAPAHALVNVVWSVSSGSPDYAYAYGTGEATPDGFDVSFPDDPPAEALNSFGVGVGVLVLMPDGQGLPDGKITGDGDAAFAPALGAAGDYAIIYKKAGASVLSWIDAFPEGYSCAKGVPKKAGETFDTFAPVDCSEIVITVDAISNIHFTNWT